jgi:hypothetical protein
LPKVGEVSITKSFGCPLQCINLADAEYWKGSSEMGGLLAGYRHSRAQVFVDQSEVIHHASDTAYELLL